MSELRAGTPKREKMLREQMLKALAPFDVPDPEGFADAFVRMSRPVGWKPELKASADLFD